MSQGGLGHYEQITNVKDMFEVKWRDKIINKTHEKDGEPPPIGFAYPAAA